ncbi:MAG: transposase zinc-binding domain-containing protein [Acidobacteriota bacterium]
MEKLGLPERSLRVRLSGGSRCALTLAFSCRARGVCSSCQAKRAALFAEKLTTEILPPVPYRNWTFTPRAIRGLFGGFPVSVNVPPTSFPWSGPLDLPRTHLASPRPG